MATRDNSCAMIHIQDETLIIVQMNDHPQQLLLSDSFISQTSRYKLSTGQELERVNQSISKNMHTYCVRKPARGISIAAQLEPSAANNLIYQTSHTHF